MIVTIKIITSQNPCIKFNHCTINYLIINKNCDGTTLIGPTIKLFTITLQLLPVPVKKGGNTRGTILIYCRNMPRFWDGEEKISVSVTVKIRE